MNDSFPAPWGEFHLTRFPEDPRDRLRAWDAADAYALRHLADEGHTAAAGVRLPVVVGDRWGAMTTALAARPSGDPPVCVGDSFMAQQATRLNLERAGIAAGGAHGSVGAAGPELLTSQEAPPREVGLLIVRVPKSLGLLEDQLHRLAPSLTAESVVVGAGMVKEIHTSTLEVFERVLGPTRTSLAERKARLIFCSPRGGAPAEPNPWPRHYPLPDGIGVLSGRQVTSHAGVFSAERLDIGTRFLLGQLPTGLGDAEVADVGCGNGLLGTALALAEPGVRVQFLDESFQAVASAEATYAENLGEDDGRARFHVGDGLAPLADRSLDLVLCNPPFHTHQLTTDATAWRMFTGARRTLRPGGRLRVVGNRHLGYHDKLRRLFGNCRTVAGSPKFVVLEAEKKR